MQNEQPDDPLKMPPPYWEDSGALDQFIRSMEMVQDLLPALADEINKIGPLVDDYHDRRDNFGEEYDPEYIEFGKITDDFMNYELSIASYADLCVLMGAISAETLINKFCVYNLHRDIAEPLERLSPPEKLIISSALVGHPGVKSRAPYEAIKELTKWRNVFAHGHCIDRPTQTIHKNHLRDNLAGIRGAHVSVNMLTEAVSRYLCVHDYLKEITQNQYVVDAYSIENSDQIRHILNELQRFSFSDLEYFPYSLEKHTNEASKGKGKGSSATVMTDNSPEIPTRPLDTDRG